MNQIPAPRHVWSDWEQKNLQVGVSNEFSKSCCRRHCFGEAVKGTEKDCCFCSNWAGELMD